MTEQWYYLQGEQAYGPLSREHLKKLIAQGVVSRIDLAGTDVDDLTRPVATFEELVGAAQGTVAAAVGIAEPMESVSERTRTLSYQRRGGGGIMMTAQGMTALKATRPWVTFLGIAAMVGVAMGVLMVVVTMALGLRRGEASVELIVNVGIWVIFLAVQAVLGALQLQYGAKIARAVATGSTRDLEGAMVAQKWFWQLTGIIVLVGIVLTCVIGGLLLTAGATLFRV